MNEAWTPAAHLPENTNWGWSDKMIICQFAEGDLRPFMFLASYDFSRSQWRTPSGPVENVTHWQPLPALPKEYQNE